MDDREPTIRSRELGEGMRKAMEAARLTGKEAAFTLGWSESRLSRVLAGRRGIGELDVAAFLGVCKVKGAERERLLALCREQRSQGWWQQHGSRLPRQLVTLIDHENRATKIAEFEPILVPGLLQTGDYARALCVGWGRTPDAEFGDHVAARLARQNLFSRGGVEFVFYIHEFVLRLPVGGSVVMSDQLHHLIRMSVRPRLFVRVIPASIGGHPAVAGSFRVMEFADFKPITYLENETSSLFLEKREETAVYQEILASLDAVALSVGDSRESIAQVAIELYSDREDHDGHG